MKKTKLIFLKALALSSVNAHAGIPVFDGVEIAQSIQQVLSWTTQLSQMANQLTTEVNQLEGMTGSRMLGMIKNDPTLRQYMPNDIGTSYSSISSSGYGGLTSDAKSLRDATKVYNCEGVTSDFANICSANLNKNSQDLAYSQSAYTTATNRNAQIQDLQGEINSTTDAKAIAELQARIDSEGVSVANEQNRLAIAQQMQAATDRANQQQVTEWYLSSIKRPSVMSGFVYTP